MVLKRSIKNCGRSWLHKLHTVKRDERTDRQTDGQTGANLNAPWLSSRGHKYTINTVCSQDFYAKHIKGEYIYQKPLKLEIDFSKSLPKIRNGHIPVNRMDKYIGQKRMPGDSDKY